MSEFLETLHTVEQLFKSFGVSCKNACYQSKGEKILCMVVKVQLGANTIMQGSIFKVVVQVVLIGDTSIKGYRRSRPKLFQRS